MKSLRGARSRSAFLSTLPEDSRVHDVFINNQQFQSNYQYDITNLLLPGTSDFTTPSHKPKWLTLRYRMRWYRIAHASGYQPPFDFGVYVVVDTAEKPVTDYNFFGGSTWVNGVPTTNFTAAALVNNPGGLLYPNAPLRAQARVVSEDLFVVPATDNGSGFFWNGLTSATINPPPAVYDQVMVEPFGKTAAPDHCVHERFIELGVDAGLVRVAGVSNQFLPRIVFNVVAQDAGGIGVPGWRFDVAFRLTYREFAS